MICFPNAKINIGLTIIEKRPDNFHNLETLFYPIPLTDILEIIEKNNDNGGKVELKVTGTDISCDPESNLCVKAYRLLDRDYGIPPVQIMLHKVIPMGAGLGGGSSDGAFTLTLLNKTFNLNISNERLKAYAARLGSDCAFFVENEPAFGVQKGEVLIPSEVDLSHYFLVLVKPNVFVGTAEAYAGITPAKPELSLQEYTKWRIEKWKDFIVNDFEKSIFSKHPEIPRVKNLLYENGAVYASMSGSGSSVYGLFKEETNLRELFPDCFYFEGKLGG